jgi:hypothetical protein
VIVISAHAEPMGFVNSVVADLQGNRAGAREARLADRVAAVTLATAAPPFSPWSRAADATPPSVWGAQIRFRLAVQAWVNSVDFAHPLRGWVRLTTKPQI